ncbi:MAG: hypothetical protein ACXWH7_00445 [Thermoanaerobaculia bacterium]
MQLARIATFLNLATDKIKAEGGSIQWLTGTATTIAYEATAASQETQCLWFGSTLWIANNEDRDSVTQQTLLNALGIKKPARLNELAANHSAKTLQYHGAHFVPHGMTPKQKFMHALLGGGAMVPGAAFVVPTAVANGEYSIVNKGGCPAVGGIVFVKGTYDADADGGASEHAEQRLVAALGLLLKNSSTTPVGAVLINGCKSACGSCRRAMKSVVEHLDALKQKNFWLSFQNETLNAKRDTAGLGADDNAGIKKLDVTAYFPAIP